MKDARKLSVLFLQLLVSKLFQNKKLLKNRGQMLTAEQGSVHGERRCISELPPGEGAACGSVRRPGINLETRGVRTGGGERAERLRAAGSRGRAVGAGGRMNRWPTGSPGGSVSLS